MGEQMVLFSNENNITTVREAYDSLSNIITTTDNKDFQHKIIDNFLTMLGAITANPKFWDEHASYSIEILGERFITLLKTLKHSKEEKIIQLELMYSMCFRFLYEGFLSTETDFDHDLLAVINFTKSNISNFSENAKSGITFSIRDLPSYLFKSLLNKPAIKSLGNIGETIRQAEDLTNNWNKTLQEKTDEANQLKLSIEKYKDAFNFVGLHDGFNSLYQQKKKERNNLIGMMVLSIVLIMAPLVYKMLPTFKQEQQLSSFSYVFALSTSTNKVIDNTVSKNAPSDISNTIISLLPTVSYIAILLYLFRVLLFNYKSVCAQLLQIELRMTLCRFIMHYSEYAAKIRSKSDITLERFESVIFAGLVSNEGDLPATFDGIDQLTALFKSVKTN
ncbi:hypothetical protein [Aeromonas sp. AE23HZ002T15]